MKIAIILLLSTVSATKLRSYDLFDKQYTFAELQDLGKQHMEYMLNDLNDQQLENLIDKKIAMINQIKITNTDTAVEQDGEMKTIESALALRLLNKLKDKGVNVFSQSLNDDPTKLQAALKYSDIYKTIDILRAYHDAILRWEVRNSIFGLVSPSIETVTRILTSATDVHNMKAPSLVQHLMLEDEGKPTIDKSNKNLNSLNNEQLAKLIDNKMTITLSSGITNVDEGIELDKEMKYIQATLANRIVQRLQLNGINVNARQQDPSNLEKALRSPEISKQIEQLKAFTDSIIKWETANAIAGLVAPSIETIARILDTASALKFGGNTPSDNKSLMVESEGVPVFVNPILMQNEEENDDLGENKMRVGWDNGINLLQTEGVPVFVEPQLLQNEEEFEELDEKINRLGWDNDIKLLQINDEEDIQDQVILQVNGVPVIVNPESLLLKNEVASSELHRAMGLKSNQYFKVGPDQLNLVELDNPVVNPPFNNWSVNQPSVTHVKGMNGDEDVGLRNIIIDGVNGFDLVQFQNPVKNPPFNNWSVNQPAKPHDKGMNGDEDLKLDLIVDGHKVHIAQKE